MGGSAFGNPDQAPDPGRPQYPNEGKNMNYLCFEERDVLSWVLEAFLGGISSSGSLTKI
jgi:hypothetical protein